MKQTVIAEDDIVQDLVKEELCQVEEVVVVVEAVVVEEEEAAVVEEVVAVEDVVVPGHHNHHQIADEVDHVPKTATVPDHVDANHPCTGMYHRQALNI